MDWQPRREQEKILKRAFEHIGSVPYRVSLRWVFYRLLQDGLYESKDDYNNLKQLTIKARKIFYKDWRPATLADDTRSEIIQHGRFHSPEEWLAVITEGVRVDLDEWYSQRYYVETWFEARAMTEQFRHFVEHATLVPFGGDASLPYKWSIAKRLEKASEKYGLPIKILYFGDCDKKGFQIPNSALEDIREWCEVHFDFEIGGLTDEQAQEYNLPENPEKPSQYQWEALSDEQARKIITNALDEYLNYEAFEEVKELEENTTLAFRKAVENIEL